MNQITKPGRDVDKKHTDDNFSKINIWLDSYDDIFSDFDSSDYSEKTLSDDFISQVKKISKNKRGKDVSLRFFIPLNQRNNKSEETIIRRLSLYFTHINNQLKADIKKTYIKGWTLTTTGITLMVVASYLSFIKSQMYTTHLMLVLFEPAGWFLLWAGLDNIVYNSKDFKKEIDFYSKMTGAKIDFLTLTSKIE